MRSPGESIHDAKIRRIFGGEKWGVSVVGITRVIKRSSLPVLLIKLPQHIEKETFIFKKLCDQNVSTNGYWIQWIRWMGWSLYADEITEQIAWGQNEDSQDWLISCEESWQGNPDLKNCIGKQFSWKFSLKQHMLALESTYVYVDLEGEGWPSEQPWQFDDVKLEYLKIEIEVMI